LDTSTKRSKDAEKEKLTQNLLNIRSMNGEKRSWTLPVGGFVRNSVTPGQRLLCRVRIPKGTARSTETVTSLVKYAPKLFIHPTNLRDDEITGLDGLLDVTGGLAIDGATNRVGSAEDLKNRALKLAGHGAAAELLGDRNDGVEGDIAVVEDVLLLLAVALRLLEGANDERSRRGHELDLRLAVLDSQLDGDTEALEGLGGGGDIVGDLLGGL
jgi:hypothetical protein